MGRSRSRSRSPRRRSRSPVRGHAPPPPPRAQPASLEALLAQRAAASAASAKPVFVSKAARAARPPEAPAPRPSAPAPLPAAQRRASAPPAASAAQQRSLDAIKASYMGAAPKPKVAVKASEKMRFNMSWEAADDTSAPEQRVSGAAPALLFGRGRLGGVERGEKRYDAKAKPATPALTWQDKPLDALTERDWRAFREQHAISVRGGALPKPFRSWLEAPLPPQLLQAVARVGYAKPSPIQMAAIPCGLAGRDVIGVAETGSGKTCAFVLPLLAYIMALPPMAGNEAVEALGPYGLVLSPTRELAQQTEAETSKFAHFLNYRVVSIVGGQSIEEQGFKLRQGCEIIIGTPGRVQDCLERRYTVLNQCNFVVLDEADRMIDYGFEPQVVAVLESMPSTNLKPAEEDGVLEADKVYRTTFMFSATMPPVVERLARTYMRNPCTVTIGSAGKAADLIQQIVLMCRTDDKPALLEQQLNRYSDTQAIVFVNSHKVCDYVSKMVEKSGRSICVLHGGKTQDAREASIEGFRAKKFRVLIATDVAGRGIDVPDVGLVVNYQMPSAIEPYTHRIGRTGRAGRKGVAVSLVTNEDQDLFFELRNTLLDSGNAVPAELDRHPAARSKKADKEKFGRNIDA